MSNPSNKNSLYIYCVYHKNQLVTNFCCSKDCNIPLCSVCVKEHQQKHLNERTIAQFDTFPETVEKKLDEITTYLSMLKDQSDQIKINQNGFNQDLEGINKKIQEARNRCVALIDDYFRALQSEYIAYTKQQKSYNEEKMNYLGDQIEKRAAINVKIAKGLQSEKTCIDNLLNYIHNDVYNDNYRVLFELKNNTMQTSLELQVDDAQLYNMFMIMSKFVKISDKRVSQNKPEPKQQPGRNVQSQIPAVVREIPSQNSVPNQVFYQPQQPTVMQHQIQVAQPSSQQINYVRYPIQQQTQSSQIIARPVAAQLSSSQINLNQNQQYLVSSPIRRNQMYLSQLNYQKQY